MDELCHFSFLKIFHLVIERLAIKNHTGKKIIPPGKLQFLGMVILMVQN